MKPYDFIPPSHLISLSFPGPSDGSADQVPCYGPIHFHSSFLLEGHVLLVLGFSFFSFFPDIMIPPIFYMFFPPDKL